MTWYRDASRARAGSSGCWLYGPLTVEWDPARPESALLAAADHILARTDQPSLVEWVAVDNLLRRGTAQYGFGIAQREMSPRVALRRLQVVEGAARAPDAQAPSVLGDPLRLAWLLDRDELRFHEPAGGWMMEADVYWQLYERYRDHDAADEIAWAAAQAGVPADECYASCLLSAVRSTWGRYWQERPAGAHVAEAVRNALEATSTAIRRGCEDDDPSQARSLAPEILSSLEAVPAPQKAALEDQLRRLERDCGRRP